MKDSEPQDSPDRVTWRRVRRVNDGFPALMVRFVLDVYGADAIDEAWSEFTVWCEETFDENSPHLPLFMPWMYHCWKPDPLEDTCVADASLHGRAPTEVLLERRGSRLDPLLRRYLQVCLDAPFTFYEVERCDPGKGLRARDVLTGESHEVLERSASQRVQEGDILFAQLVPIDGIVVIEACPQIIVPPIHKLRIIELRERMMPRIGTDLFAGELLREMDIELRELYLAIVEDILDPPPLVLHNTDGDKLALQTVIFGIDSPQAAFDALRHLALGDSTESLLSSAERDAQGALLRVAFAWKKAGNRKHASWDNTILGHLEIDRDQLRANVNSDKRATQFRKIVRQALGKSARYLRTELVDMQQPGRGGETPDADEHRRLAEQPEVREALNNMLATHYESWVQQEIPLLGNRCPIDAVRDHDGREKVAALVRQIEQDTQRMHPGLDPAILARLRERLGLGD